MIKVLLLDFDGVVADCDMLHDTAFYQALDSVANIKLTDVEKYNLRALTSVTKVQQLSFKYNIDEQKKQEILSTKDRIKKNIIAQTDYKCIHFCPYIHDVFAYCKEHGIKIGLVSNSKRWLLDTVLEQLNHSFEHIISNEDIEHPKPAPDAYLKALQLFNVNANEALAVEDSPYGIESAKTAGIKTIGITSHKSLTASLIHEYRNGKTVNADMYPMHDVQLVIPAAGRGTRFHPLEVPKPFAPINKLPMIQAVINNIGLDCNTHIILREDIKEYAKKLPYKNIHYLPYVTCGTVSTMQWIRSHLDMSKPLIIANCDQMIKYDSKVFYKAMIQKLDGAILTFRATHEKWSYAKVDNQGYVTEVAEKVPISDLATVGIYFWTKAHFFFDDADEMMENNDTVNNEFYTCPTYNYSIKKGRKIKTFDVDEMIGLGTYEDYTDFINK